MTASVVNRRKHESIRHATDDRSRTVRRTCISQRAETAHNDGTRCVAVSAACGPRRCRRSFCCGCCPLPAARIVADRRICMCSGGDLCLRLPTPPPKNNDSSHGVWSGSVPLPNQRRHAAGRRSSYVNGSSVWSLRQDLVYGAAGLPATSSIRECRPETTPGLRLSPRWHTESRRRSHTHTRARTHMYIANATSDAYLGAETDSAPRHPRNFNGRLASLPGRDAPLYHACVHGFIYSKADASVAAASLYGRARASNISWVVE